VGAFDTLKPNLGICSTTIVTIVAKSSLGSRKCEEPIKIINYLAII